MHKKESEVMGVGGGLRGHNIQNSGGSGRAGRPYGSILLLFIALGALLFGVTALHKQKEKRVFELVIKDKDLQLHSLHLHLQKERDFAKEAKRKSDEFRSELYTLRNQKSELRGKILEMQSTISSLKEEHKTIESALEEKQNEIDLMKEREKHINEQNIHESVLADGTVSTNKENGGRLRNYIKIADGENSANGEDGRETENVDVSRNISGEEPLILKSSQHGFQQKNTTNENHGEQMSYKFSKDNGGLNLEAQKGYTNGTEARANSIVDFEKPKAVDGATLAANTVVNFNKTKDVDGDNLTANTKLVNNGQAKNVVGSTRGKRFFRNERDGKQKERPGEAELLPFEEKGQSLGYHSSNVLKSNTNNENRTSERFPRSANEVQVNKNTSDNRKKKPKGIVHPEAKANGNQHRTERSGNDKPTNPKRGNIANRNADIAGWEIKDTYESDAHNLAVQLLSRKKIKQTIRK